MIKIDKGVPMPPDTAPAQRYPLTSMAIGDSFFLPTQSAVEDARIRAAAGGATRREKLAGRTLKFAARKLTEGGVRGVRVWRTA